VWDASENYWPARPDGADPEVPDPFADASGFELFEQNSALLARLGVRSPRIVLADAGGTLHPAPFAVVEDVRGGSLESLLVRDPPAGDQALTLLAETLAVLHAERHPGFGKPADLAAYGLPRNRTCEQVVLDRALRQLVEGAARVERMAQARRQLEATLHRLAGSVELRAEHSLIHGELGPDHVLIDDDGRPVIIDIEGLMFFDVEWEHAFLELRFHEHYRTLRAPGLDPRRLQLYRLALHLSLVAGPLRLLDGDFPHREVMQQIVDWNVERSLDFVS
jgi:aminoglycoside phosphotransferase (APT) family kinase protein